MPDCPERGCRVDLVHQPEEVLSEEAGDEGEREENAGDDGEPSHDVVLLCRDLVLTEVDQRKVCLERRGELVALAEKLLVDPAHVVVEIAEVPEQAAVDRREQAPLERVEGRKEWMDGAVEVRDLLLELVDPLRQVLAAGEDRALGVLDVALEPVHDRLVVVDDRVEDGPDRGGRPCPREVRVLLQMLARSLVVAGLVVADRDDEADAEEEVELAEDHLAVLGVVPGRPVDDEVEVVVGLDLRTLVREGRVLDGELVQSEVPAHFRHQLRRTGRRARSRRSSRRGAGTPPLPRV